jgi:hypothetical protein
MYHWLVDKVRADTLRAGKILGQANATLRLGRLARMRSSSRMARPMTGGSLQKVAGAKVLRLRESGKRSKERRQEKRNRRSLGSPGFPIESCVARNAGRDDGSWLKQNEDHLSVPKEPIEEILKEHQ